MNEPVSHCGHWHEPISLMAAGCLSVDEEAVVRRHLAKCAACSARLAELMALCTSLARSRPAAAERAAAVRDRWRAAGLRTRRPRPWARPATLLWVGGGLAAAVVVSASLLVDRKPDCPPSPPSARVVATGGSQPELREPVRRSAVPETDVPQPTLLAYELALAESDEAFEALLRRPGESMMFDRNDVRSLLEECL